MDRVPIALSGPQRLVLEAITLSHTGMQSAWLRQRTLDECGATLGDLQTLLEEGLVELRADRYFATSKK
jgi:hypothetical protein